MISYKIKYSKRAESFIRDNKLVGIRFIKALTEISHAPNNIESYDIKKYVSVSNTDLFCIRIAHYRAIFKIIEKSIIFEYFIDDNENEKNKIKPNEKDNSGNNFIDLILSKPINPAVN